MSRVVVLCVLVLGTCGAADAQWVKYVPAGTPKTADGAPNLSAPTPRTAERRPDLSGVWQAQGGPIPDLIKLLPGGENGLGEDLPSKYFVDVLVDFKQGQEPLQPTAAARSATLSVSSRESLNVSVACLPSGMPLMMTTPAPFKIVQTPRQLVVLSEADSSFRQIFTDGRPLPANVQPSWMGSSIGHWDGDTLVVETVGFNDHGLLDAIGHRHSDALRLTERYHRRDFGHMDVEMTFTDPKTFTRPVTIRVPMVLRADTDLIENFCTENEKDHQHVALK